MCNTFLCPTFSSSPTHVRTSTFNFFRISSGESQINLQPSREKTETVLNIEAAKVNLRYEPAPSLSHIRLYLLPLSRSLSVAVSISSFSRALPQRWKISTKPWPWKREKTSTMPAESTNARRKRDILREIVRQTRASSPINYRRCRRH